jgi:hypothetical protein
MIDPQISFVVGMIAGGSLVIIGAFIAWAGS